MNAACRSPTSTTCRKATWSNATRRRWSRVEQADPNAATLTKFQAEQSSYSRSDIVMKAGWATLDGTANGNDALARACADKLHVAKTS
jgi:hypothetical protein